MARLKKRKGSYKLKPYAYNAKSELGVVIEPGQCVNKATLYWKYLSLSFPVL